MTVEYKHPEHAGVIACFVEDEEYYLTLPPWGGWQVWGPEGPAVEPWSNWEVGYV